MSQRVHDLVAVGENLNARRVDQILANLEAWGIGLATGEWLAPERAWQIRADLGQMRARDLADRLRQWVQGVDFAVTPEAIQRRKRLLCIDMDSTLVQGESLDLLADALGLGPRIAELTERAMAGELGFAEALFERVALLKGQESEVLDQLANRLQLSPGAATLINTMRHLGTHCLLLTGGFERVARPFVEQLGFHGLLSNQLVVREGRLTGGLGLPLVDAEAKAARLKATAAELDIGVNQAIALGDGANDLPMLQVAGLGVAYEAKPKVRDATVCQINHTDLSSALFFQGLNPDLWVHMD